MDIQNRLLRVVYSPSANALIASDVRGRVHKFNLDLKLLQSSPVVSYDRPINAICLTDRYILTKDRFGSIGKWDLGTLAPLDFHDGKLVRDDTRLLHNEVQSPTPNRGIAVLDGRLYTNNAYGQFVVIDVETFNVVDIRECVSPTYIDCICVDHPTLQAMTDVNGTIYFGDLAANDFPVRRKIDIDVIHGIAYDHRHDRFWTTQDGGLGEDYCLRTGITRISADAEEFEEFKLSHEDNEFIAITPDGGHVFAGGFNGKISVFDNAERAFRLARVIGPLDFQVIHAAVVDVDRIYVLLQTGDLIRLDGEGKETARAGNRGRCVWTLEPHPGDNRILYAGTDQGVSLIYYQPGRHGSVEIEELDCHRHGFGICKDVRPLPDGSYIAISRKGLVFKAQADGAILWQRPVLGIPRGCALSRDYRRCMVASDDGTLTELATEDGSLIDAIPVGSPAYACLYLDDGRRVVTASKGPHVHVYAADSHRLLGSIKFESRLKRLMRGANGEAFVAGPDGMFELDLDRFETRRKFGDMMVSTKENGVLCAGHFYMGGYGYQVASYRYDDGELIDFQEMLPDFTKAFAAREDDDGTATLLVGGRGGFINAYRLERGVPHKVREFYIS